MNGASGNEALGENISMVTVAPHGKFVVVSMTAYEIAWARTVSHFRTALFHA